MEGNDAKDGTQGYSRIGMAKMQCREDALHCGKDGKRSAPQKSLNIKS